MGMMKMERGTLTIYYLQDGEKEKMGSFESDVFIEPSESVINKTIPINREITLSGTLHVPPMLYYRMLGIKMTNNYLKLHGGIMQRKTRKRRRKKK